MSDVSVSDLMVCLCLVCQYVSVSVSELTVSVSACRKFIKAELDRHRPSLGTCLGAFAACFPVAFLEPDLNQYNQYSIHGRLQERSLEAQGEATGGVGSRHERGGVRSREVPD